ncbi:PH domain-containing protein [Bacillus benzoevorans]|uniref:Putative membrane protein n=1 Tax=Bacillus benzoevorans TaxID=1456 RepID=A0A7X0LXI9_9BACI|nr:PH domain-containing protein [Bacillus benzoevorans]MBB6447670.1 putative membrane protein [Bacillus benzoevorans]
MSERKRLHPISAVANTLKQIKEMILPFVLLFVVGRNGDGDRYWFYIVAAMSIIFPLISGILTWMRYTYRIEEGELRIESGIFVKKKRYIPFERIQSLDFSEGVLQRMFGLVKVKVETAGSTSLGEAEAVLTAITKEEARAIQETLSLVKNGKDAMRTRDEEVPEERASLYHITPSQLVLLATTSGGAGVILSAIVAFIFQFDELIPYKKVYNEFQHFIANGIVFVSLAALLVFLVAWILAFISTLLKYANFTVQKVEGDLIISRGLLEKRQITIPINRIQGIRISENLIRQPLRLATVYVESAGGSIDKESKSTIMVLPIVKKRKIPELLHSILPDYDLHPEVVSVPKRAWRRYMFRGLLFPILLVLGAVIFFRPWGWLSLLLIPLTAVWAHWKYKDAGWSVNDVQLTLTYRGIIKNTVMMKRNKIQTLSIQKNYFQKRQGLATVQATIISGIGGSGGTVNDLEAIAGMKIYHWYSRHQDNII